jgi:peptidoglycan/xylan/chitin deacetylase (PgdA/CDA1 family)
MKSAVLRFARLAGLFALSRWWTRRHLRILCYHGIWIGPQPHYGDCLFMSVPTFAARMAMLEREGYRVISLDEAMRRHASGTNSARDVVITIDDAWLGTYRHMVPELVRRGFPATLYVTTYYALTQRPVMNVMLGYLVARTRPTNNFKDLADLLPSAEAVADPVRHLADHVDAQPTLEDRWNCLRTVARRLGWAGDLDDLAPAFRLMDEEQLRDARHQGIDLQLHTHTHRMHGHEPARVQAEIETNRGHMARVLGVPAAELHHFCYPSGDYERALFPALIAAQVDSATTTELGLNPPSVHPLAMKRILDGETLSELELEARLSGFWSLALGLRQRLG